MRSRNRTTERSLEVGLTVERGPHEIDLVIVGDVEAYRVNGRRYFDPEITSVRTMDGAEWTGTLTEDEGEQADELLCEQFDRVRERSDDRREALREDAYDAGREAR